MVKLPDRAEETGKTQAASTGGTIIVHHAYRMKRGRNLNILFKITLTFFQPLTSPTSHMSRIGLIDGLHEDESFSG